MATTMARESNSTPSPNPLAGVLLEQIREVSLLRTEAAISEAYVEILREMLSASIALLGATNRSLERARSTAADLRDELRRQRAGRCS